MSEVTQLEFGDGDDFNGLSGACIDIQAVDNGFIVRTRYNDDTGFDEIAITLKELLNLIKSNLSK